jgi:hypothetical protein
VIEVATKEAGMKSKRVVIPVNHYPTRSPALATAVLYMALDIYKAPGWVWGVLGTLMAAAWIGWVITLRKQEEKPLPGYGDLE